MAFWARWGVARRIAWRDAVRHKRRTALTLAMIGLPVAALVFAVSTVASSQPGPAMAARAELGPGTVQARVNDLGCGGCRVYQDPQGYGTYVDQEDQGDVGGQGATGEPVTAEEIAGLLPGTSVEDLTTSSVLATSAERAGQVDAATASPELISALYTAREGALPAAAGEAAVNRYLADRFDLSVGDTLDLGGREVVITALLDQRWLPGASLVVPAGTLEEPGTSLGRYVLGGDGVSWQEVLALNERGVVVLSRQVLLDPPPSSQVPSREYLVGAGYGLGTIGVGAAVAAIALIEAVLLIGPAFAVGARRRTRQLALVAASGGNARDLRRIVLASGVVIGAVAGILGAVVGYAAAIVAHLLSLRQDWPQPNLVLPWWAGVGAVLFAVGMGTLASWMPARAAGRVDVVAALAGRRVEAVPHRRVPWVGVSLAVLGLAASVYGALAGRLIALVGGIVVLEIGVVLATGGILAMLGALAPRLGVAARLAVRDAVRQRGRTVPAVASVLAAIAAVTAGTVYFATDQGLEERAWTPSLGIGTISLATYDVYLADEAERALAVVARTIPIAASAPVSLLGAAPEDSEPASVGAGGPTTWVWATPVLRPELECPGNDVEITSPEENLTWEETYGEDPRCQFRPTVTSSVFYGPSGDGPWVDDGGAVALIGFDGADEAAQALARGEIVVPSPDFVQADGSAEILVSITSEQATEPTEVVLTAPAHVVDWPTNQVVLPSSLVADETRLTSVPAGIIAQPVGDVPSADVDRARKAINDTGAEIGFNVQQPYSTSIGILMLVLVALAAVVGLGATWLSIGLAAAETRPDLATLSAVGASPAVRRRVAAAQAAVIAVVGVGAGVVLGLVLGWVLGTWTISSSDGYYGGLDLDGTVVVPWLVVAAIALVIPALAVGGAWLTAPRHLPLVRRLAQ